MGTCKHCKEKFEPIKKGQKYCLKDECIEVWVQEVKEKNWKAKKKRMKEDLKTVTDYTRDAQKIVNQYIRLRDKDLDCISCGADLDARNTNAGHHFSANGFPNTRFNEDNIHNQCVYCNQHNSGNLLEYRKGLIDKIGQERYDKLEAESKEKKSYTKEELKNIIKKFKEKCRLLTK